jgi:hypothetical protein
VDLQPFGFLAHFRSLARVSFRNDHFYIERLYLEGNHVSTIGDEIRCHDLTDLGHIWLPRFGVTSVVVSECPVAPVVNYKGKSPAFVSAFTCGPGL